MPTKAVATVPCSIPEFTTDYREVLARTDLDAVVFLTAVQSHGEITRAALAAGKYRLAKKAMSMDLAEAALIVEQAKTAPGILVCAPHVTLSRTYQDMWRAIDADWSDRPRPPRHRDGRDRDPGADCR